ncbi:hypothetical protein LZ554_001364 [Drepanopeziza brunnea f. sp. 'monogermtubi']|nr:hypothetical protein LZ554_001364 [Drepanopeziza brunnea f. sp. 'monogermtubi']
MCHYRITTYDNCKAIRMHLLVCANQVEHTFLQIDNNPCGRITSTKREQGVTTYCNSFGERRGDTGYTWAFEEVPDRASERAEESRARNEAEEIARAAAEMISLYGGGVGGPLGPGRRGAIDLGGSRDPRARHDDQAMGSGVLTDNAGNNAKKRKLVEESTSTVVDKENDVGQDVDMGL